ncbi:hypothetical protein MKX03_021992, partial [Papaver bracteatum]
MDLLSMLILLQQWVGEQLISYSNEHFFFISVPVLLFSVFFLFKIHKVWSSSIKSHLYKLPPSPPKFPIIGNFHQLGTVAHRSFRNLSQKYGPLMFLRLGQSPTLVVSSVEMAKEILKNQDLVFANRPSTTAGNALLYGSTDIGLAPYGEYWRQVKKICILVLLSPKRVQSFKHVRVEEVSVLIGKIASSCSSREAAAQVVNLTELLLTFTNNVVSSFADFFPSLGWMDVVTGLHRKLKKVSKELDIFLDQVIDEHLLRHSEAQDDHGQVQDSNKLNLTDILILSQEDYKNLSRNNIKAILL